MDSDITWQEIQHGLLSKWNTPEFSRMLHAQNAEFCTSAAMSILNCDGIMQSSKDGHVLMVKERGGRDLLRYWKILGQNKDCVIHLKGTGKKFFCGHEIYQSVHAERNWWMQHLFSFRNRQDYSVVLFFPYSLKPEILFLPRTFLALNHLFSQISISHMDRKYLQLGRKCYIINTLYTRLQLLLILGRLSIAGWGAQTDDFISHN